jgi:3-deoxy-D-arabino-heptulosonate 7-phosphate (DAHP) synthase class II
VSLICRYGAGKVEDFLANHIDEVEASGHRVVWVCDPMHGNTKTAENSTLKTRAFGDIIHEITASMRIVRSPSTLFPPDMTLTTLALPSSSTPNAVRSSAVSISS